MTRSIIIFKPLASGAARHLPDLIFRRCGALRVQQGRVDSEIIGNRIEAARGARLLDGINIDPVEAHRRRPGEMLAPAGKRAGKEGEKIIERHRMWSVGRAGKSAGIAPEMSRPGEGPDARSGQMSLWFIGASIIRHCFAATRNVAPHRIRVTFAPVWQSISEGSALRGDATG